MPRLLTLLGFRPLTPKRNALLGIGYLLLVLSGTQVLLALL